MFDVSLPATARIMTRNGLCGQRIGEAANPGPASKRPRTQRLRACQRFWDSDTEPEDDIQNVAPRLEVLQGTLVDSEDDDERHFLCACVALRQTW